MRQRACSVCLVLAVCVFACGEARAAGFFGAKHKDRLKTAEALVASAKKAASLDDAVKDLQSARDELKPVTKSKLHMLLARKARKMVARINQDLGQLKALQKCRDDVTALLRQRKFQAADTRLKEFQAQAPKEYARCVTSEADSVKKKAEEARRVYARWVRLSEAMEKAFRDREEYLYWRKPTELFSAEEADTLVKGYTLGYDTPAGGTPHYKLGWLAATLGKNARDARQHFDAVTDPGHQALGHFFLGLAYEREGDFLSASEHFKAASLDRLPDTPRAIAERRQKVYALVGGRFPKNDKLFRDFGDCFFEALRNSPLDKRNALDRQLYPAASARVGEYVRSRFDDFLALDWSRNYAVLDILYRRKGTIQLYQAIAPREKQMLEAPIKLICFMLFEANLKGFDFLEEPIAEKYAWFSGFLDSAGPGTTPEALADDLQSRLNEAWGRDLKYFFLAKEGRWREAVASLRKALEEKKKEEEERKKRGGE